MGDPDYAYGQERLAVATSKDGGMTWEKCRKNPLPVMPPADVSFFGAYSTSDTHR